jgi:ubiquinone/menaquinone biosynthesis C-methylase UbiE
MVMTVGRVAYIFNEMKDHYDDLKDLWYAWLFSRLHFLIAKHVVGSWNEPLPRKVLDVGCGTGFQSFLYARAGAEVVGIDIASDLVARAKAKSTDSSASSQCKLFPAYFDFVERYDRKIGGLIGRSHVRKPVSPTFAVADATALPFADDSFDHVNCCGSTMSFIAAYEAALAETRRVLKPGGTFVLEVEARYNPDTVWMLMDPLLRGALGFETSLGEALRTAFRRPRSHVIIEYPFGDVKNPVSMEIRLFVAGTLKREMSRLGLKVNKLWSIHSWTNLIPSTFLDENNPSKILRRIFSVLAWIEERFPIRTPGCSLVMFGDRAR